MIMTFLARFAIGRALSAFASKLPWQIWAALAVIVFLGASAWYIDRTAFTRGFSRADAQWVAKVEAEVARQTEINNTALRAAEETIARLNEAKEVRDATIERLNREAAEDPNANRESIGVDGVRRLDNQH